jgi:hypothetical protein
MRTMCKGRSEIHAEEYEEDAVEEDATEEIGSSISCPGIVASRRRSED